MKEEKLEGKTLAQWKALMAEHKTKRPSNTSPKLRQWVYEKDAIQFRIDQLQTIQDSAWKNVVVARG